MKKSFYTIMVLALAAGMFSCKPKESAFKAAYEKAQEKPTTVVAQTPAVETKPTAQYQGGAQQEERIEAVEHADTDKLHQYNVVLGSFMNKTNANGLKDFLVAEGFNAFLAQNEKGMYRVIAASFPDRNLAATSREAIKRDYPNRFNDAWLLINK